MGRRERKIKDLKENKKLSLKNFLVGLTLLFVIGSVSLLVISSYLGWGIFPTTFARILDVSVTYVPYVPKTPKQIIARSLYETSKINSGEHHFDLKVMERSGDEIERLVIAPQVLGSFKKEDGEIDFSGTLHPGFASEAGKNISEVNFVESEDYLYFKVRNLPPVADFNFPGLGEDWRKIKVSSVENQLKANTRKDDEISKTITEKTDLIFEKLSEENILQSVSTLPDEAVDGIESYHYKISLDKEGTKKVLGSLIEEQRLLSIQEISLDLWINKEKYHVHKMLIEGKLLPAQKRSGSGESNLNFKLTYKLSRAGENIEIKAPGDAKEVDSLLGLYLLLKPQENKKDPVGQLLGVTSSLGEFGANFLTVERLLHVLYLAPQSF